MFRQFEGEKQFARQELKKCLGQVLYLKNLAKVENACISGGHVLERVSVYHAEK